VSEPLTAILALASDGTSLTCTLSPETVQLIFFALGMVEDRDAWVQQFGDTVSDAEWETIQALLANVATEMLP